jgi:hypothetical protein
VACDFKESAWLSSTIMLSFQASESMLTCFFPSLYIGDSFNFLVLNWGQHHQVYGFSTVRPNGQLPSKMDSLVAWFYCHKVDLTKSKGVMWVVLSFTFLPAHTIYSCEDLV